MRKSKRVFIVLLGLFCGIALSAQETTSEIQVRVLDDKGNGLQGATVTANHIPTGTHYITYTRKDVLYNLPNTRDGVPYAIIVRIIRFKEEKQDIISLHLGQ